jgi:predicted alpha/beta superfamily hydrolase
MVINNQLFFVLKYTNIFLTISLTLCQGIHAQQRQQTSVGKIEHLDSFQSKYIETRNIDVWLPQNYDGKRKFSVLYMHDGQMLFDSTNTWNKSTWDVDDVSNKLMKEGKVSNFIIVGIWNAGIHRHKNYFPQKPFEKLTSEQKKYVNNQLAEKGRTVSDFIPNSDAYLKFIVKELKPFIDKTYKVHKDQKHTFIAGSSMGGLISIYAICEYPQVFYGAACISTHWPGIFSIENNPIPDKFYAYLNQNLPNPSNHKIYFDHGTATLDALYPPLQKGVDQIMMTKGYTSKNWVTEKINGADHSENAWHDRIHLPLTFLMAKNN